MSVRTLLILGVLLSFLFPTGGHSQEVRAKGGDTIEATSREQNPASVVVVPKEVSVKLVSAIVTISPVEAGPDKIPNMFDVIVASRLFEGDDPRPNVNLRVGFHDQSPGDDSEIIGVASQFDALLSQETQPIQARQSDGHFRRERSAVLVSHTLNVAINPNTAFTLGAMTAPFPQHLTANVNHGISTVWAGGSAVEGVPLSMSPTEIADASLILTPISEHWDRDKTYIANQHTDEMEARTNEEGMIYTRIRLAAQRAGVEPHELRFIIVDPDAARDLGLHEVDVEAIFSGAPLGDIKEEPEGLAGTLSSVVSDVGRVFQDPGFLLKVLTDNKNWTRFMIQKYLDFMLGASPQGFALYALVQQGILTQEEARAAMLGISFGFPNGVIAFAKDELESLKFIVVDGPQLFFDWVRKDPAGALKKFDWLVTSTSPARLLVKLTTEAVPYALSDDFQQDLKTKLIPLLRKGGEFIVTFTLAMRLEWMQGRLPIRPLMDRIYPPPKTYSQTIGGAVADKVMGWSPNPGDPYGMNAFGFLAGNFFGYTSAFAAEEIGLTLLTEGAGNLGKWIVKLEKLDKLIEFVRIVHKTPVIGRVVDRAGRLSTVRTIWTYALFLDKVGEQAKVLKILSKFGAGRGAEAAKLGRMVEKYLVKFGGDGDEFAMVLAKVAQAVDQSAVDDTVLALARVADDSGRNIVIAANRLEDSGKGIGKLVKLQKGNRSHGVDIGADLIGVDSNGFRLANRGFDEVNLREGFAKISKLDDDVAENMLKAKSSGVYDDVNLAPRVGEFLQKSKGGNLGDVVNTGGESKLIRAADRPGAAAKINGTNYTVDDLAVLLQGRGGPKGTGWKHILSRHVDGSEIMASSQASLWPTGRTIRATQGGVTKTVTTPASMTDNQIKDLIRKALESGQSAKDLAGSGFLVPQPEAARFGVTKIRVAVGSNPKKLGQVITAFPLEGPNVLRYEKAAHTFKDGAGNVLP